VTGRCLGGRDRGYPQKVRFYPSWGVAGLTKQYIFWQTSPTIGYPPLPPFQKWGFPLIIPKLTKKSVKKWLFWGQKCVRNDRNRPFPEFPTFCTFSCFWVAFWPPKTTPIKSNWTPLETPRFRANRRKHAFPGCTPPIPGVSPINDPHRPMQTRSVYHKSDMSCPTWWSTRLTDRPCDIVVMSVAKMHDEKVWDELKNFFGDGQLSSRARRVASCNSKNIFYAGPKFFFMSERNKKNIFSARC
jgi:hypothetical protein